MSPTAKKKRPPNQRRKKPPQRKRLSAEVMHSGIAMQRLKDLIPFLDLFVVVLPKVINVDWEDNDASTENPVPNPMGMGLYEGDYVVWRNHTDVAFTLEFTGDWPFSGTLADISLPAKADSASYRVTLAKGTWSYKFKSPYDGGPGGPEVTVPGG